MGTGVLPMYRDAVSAFCSLGWLGFFSGLAEIEPIPKECLNSQSYPYEKMQLVYFVVPANWVNVCVGVY